MILLKYDLFPDQSHNYKGLGVFTLKHYFVYFNLLNSKNHTIYLLKLTLNSERFYFDLIKKK